MTNREQELLGKAHEALEAWFGKDRAAALLEPEQPHEELWGYLRALYLKAGAEEFSAWLELAGAAIERGEPIERTLRDIVAKHGLNRLSKGWRAFTRDERRPSDAAVISPGSGGPRNEMTPGGER